MNKTKIVFFGTSQIATNILQELIKSDYFKISLVVTKHKEAFTAKYCKNANIEFIYPDKFNTEIIQKIKSINPEIIAVVDYGKIIPEKILNIAKKGAFNLHFSLLPKYRGASPVQSAILKGEKNSGITIFKLTKNLDDGDIFAQEKIKIENLRADKVFNLMLKISAPLFRETLENIALDKIKNGIQQKHKNATFCQKFAKESGLFDDKKENIDKLIKKIMAFYPWPSAYFIHNKFGLVKILNAKKTDLKINNKTNDLFVCDKKLFLQINDGVIEILEIQREGKKAMSGEDFAKGISKPKSNL